MSSIRPSLGAAAALAASLALAPAASADAPYRFTGIDVTGNQAHEAKVQSVGPGGKEVLFNAWADRSTYSLKPLLRDVVGAKTTALASTSSSSVLGASDDLTKVLIWTYDQLDPADTNSYGDDYLIDRTTGKATLLSRDWPNGEAYGGFTYAQVAITGDGKTVFRTTFSYDEEQPELVKIDLATKATTTLGAHYLRGFEPDTTGKVVLTDDKLLAGGRTIDLPKGPSFASPDGSAVAVKTSAGVSIVDVATGTTRAAALADFLKTNAWDLLGVANGGDTLYAGAVVTAAGAKKYAVATQNTRTGALTIVRNDVPWVSQSGSAVLSPDLQFVAFNTHVAQLGGTALQGPNVAIPEIPNNEFVPFYPGCSYGGLYAELIRPSVTLRGVSIGVNGRRPTKADVTVTLDRNGAVANKFTIAPGQRRSLTAGWGGFTITSKVTYSDGTTTSGTRKVAPYQPIKNDYNPFNGGASNCYAENGLY